MFDYTVCVFLCSYIIMVGWILFNVVVAVMLDEFLAASSKAKDAAEQELAVAKPPEAADPVGVPKGEEPNGKGYVHELDELLRILSNFASINQLDKMCNDIFEVEEGEGGGGRRKRRREQEEVQGGGAG